MANSNQIGKTGERELGRFLLRNGYLAWRTQQNRGTIRDTESPDVSSGMVPEHMIVKEDDQIHLDLYYIDKSNYRRSGVHLKPLDEFDIIPNLIIEVKKGYDAKTYNKLFQEWIAKVKKETPPDHTWALFYNRKYSGCWRVTFEIGSCRVMTTTEEDTIQALPIINKLANKRKQAYDKST